MLRSLVGSEMCIRDRVSTQSTGTSLLSMFLTILGSLLLAYAVYEQLSYLLIRRSCQGPLLVLPFFGSLFQMVLAPVPFWKAQDEYSDSDDKGISVNALAGKNMVYVTSPGLCHKVMTGLKDFILYAHPNANWLFGSENLIYMDPEPHKDMRVMLNPALFSKEALEMWRRAAEPIIRRTLEDLAGKGEVEARFDLRIMNAAASQESFVADYLTPEQKAQTSLDIVDFTMGFLSFPGLHWLPGTGMNRAVRARSRMLAILTKVADRSKQNMQAGKPAKCVMDLSLIHISEPTRLLSISYAVFCLKKKKKQQVNA
eukprot:TRINITY_DN15177_c0_g1_i13.p1 TRINITY_DN15177_c0_g1~~TRINITY_DN15177_c0_g1_i13.p1  ORF type:complete len:313 (+),score=109.62 TRINITY_DN15177_c0_g1_i13:104-1042(+)